jgi:hypothetical protein
VYLISKCQDARGILLAMELGRRGARVGVDLFDDYFSQTSDSCLVNRRQWLRQISQYSDFFLCSTERMRRVVEEFQPGKVVHVLHDTAEIPEWDPLAKSLRRNLESAVFSREILVAWFGIGDNPHFSVGLSDLCAFSHVFVGWEQEGFRVHLKILTNRRALTVSGLEKLQRLPVTWSVEEWSVEREKQVLGESLVAFLPVNGQAFSRAKSLNRALSALCGGTQVLSVGFPLYQNLDAFVYRSPSDFVRDFGNQQFKLRAETLPQLQELLRGYGNPTSEASRLHTFLKEMGARDSHGHSQTNWSSGIPAVLHGIQSPGLTHKFAQKIKALSIGTPWSSFSLNYDIRIVAVADRPQLIVYLESRASSLLRESHQSLLKVGTSADGRKVNVLMLTELFSNDISKVWWASRVKGKSERLMFYPNYKSNICSILHALFPDLLLVHSEHESPFLCKVG